MIDYIFEIESRLGEYKKLPSNPFLGDFQYAIFPALDDNLVFKILYEALFHANKALANDFFVAKTILDVIGLAPALLIQKHLNWSEFNTFQGAGLAYEGFYMTGNNFNWLGIYHPDDYVIIGGTGSFSSNICQSIYGNSDWKYEFETAYKNGRMEMYEKDYETIKKLHMNL